MFHSLVGDSRETKDGQIVAFGTFWESDEGKGQSGGGYTIEISRGMEQPVWMGKRQALSRVTSTIWK